MAETNDYKNLINDIIEKQKVILGPDLVMLKAKNVQGLTLDSNGQVLSIEGDPQQILQKLIDEYIALSGQIVKNILNPVFAKYPHIKVSIN
jgi:F0F1-type ATP synthase gamma subunit